MGMFHSTSGKYCHEVFFQPSGCTLMRSQVIQILTREEELRNSESYQSRCELALQEKSLEKLKEVTLDIQNQALADCGVNHPDGLIALHNVRKMFSEDKEIRNLVVYLREDRSRKCELLIGDKLPETKLVTLDGFPISLHSYIQKLPPLFVIEELNRKLQKFKNVANFVFVYISEAHAKDQWPLGTSLHVNVHKTIEDRLEAARMLVSDYGFEIPVLVDTMDNEFDTKYAVWPERFFVADPTMTLTTVGFPASEMGYNHKMIDLCIESCLIKSKRE